MPSAAKAWLRGLELTAPIVNQPQRLLPHVIEELAEKFDKAPALLSDKDSLTYGGLAQRSNQYSRWALEQNLAKGDTVGLVMPNCPEYMAIWLGVTRVGAVVSLLNFNLVGSSLAHCINIVAPRHIIVAAQFVDALKDTWIQFAKVAKIWVHGPGQEQFPRIELDVERLQG